MVYPGECLDFNISEQHRCVSDTGLKFNSDHFKIASFEEAFIYLQKLMAAVKDILEGIQRILAPNSNF